MTATRTSRRILTTVAALAGTVAVAAPAAALPPVGPPPILPNIPPIAALSVTPNPAAIQPVLVLDSVTPIRELQVLRGGVIVTFNASASRDPDGDIASYSWDLDGDGTFEKTTTTASTTRRYTQPGTIATRVRVTDDEGASRVKIVNLVLHRAPSPRIAAGRTVALPGDTITLNGAGSTDDGSITKHEWDLDGNGTFDTTGPTAATSFGGVGTHTVRLRVTDDKNATATSTLAIRIHRQPTADIAVRPVTPGVGQLATLDGAPSEDDGSITRYQWDLDGNGSFETDGGATPTIGTRFATAGPATVRLRVTDNDGVTADTTRTVEVAPQVLITDVTAPSLKPSRTKVRIAKGRAAVSLRCPATEATCRIGVRLRGVGPLAGKIVGRGAAVLPGGRSVTLKIALSKAAKSRVRRTGAIRTVAVVTATDAAGNRAVTRTSVRVAR